MTDCISAEVIKKDNLGFICLEEYENKLDNRRIKGADGRLSHPFQNFQF